MKKQRKTKINPIKWLITRSGNNFWKVIVLTLSSSFFSILSVAFAWAVKIILDGASEGVGFSGKVVNGSIFITVILLLQFLFRIINNGLTEHVKGKLEMNYKSYIFRKILSKKYDKVTNYHTGEILNRITNDVNVVSEGVTVVLPTAISAVVRLLVAVVSLVFLDPSFAIIFVLVGGSVAIVMALLRGKLKSLHKDIQRSEGQVRSFMQEVLEKLLTVKVFSAKNKLSDKADSLQKENFLAKMKRKNYSVLGTAIYGFLYSAGYVLALIYGAVKIANGTGFSYGSLMAVLQLVNNVQIPFSSLSGVVPKYYATIGSCERLIELDEIEEDETENVMVNETYSKLKGIEISNLSFVYDREVVFENASATIPKGKFTLISGESGKGKSTLFKLLLGIHEYQGDIFLVFEDGKRKINKNDISLFSLLSQGNYTFSGTVKENVTLFNDEYSDEEVKRALDLSLSSEFVDSFPLGINTVIGENGLGLSEGQAQRLAIARSLLSRRKIILLDEATSALDLLTEEKVLDNLKNLEDQTIILISHKEKALNVCNEHLVIKDKKFEKIK